MCLSQRLCFYIVSSKHWNWCQAISWTNVLSCWFNRLHWHIAEWWKKCISCCCASLASAVTCLRSQFVFYLLKSTQHQLPPVNNFNMLDNTTCNGSFNKVFSTPLHLPPPVWGMFVDLFLWNNSWILHVSCFLLYWSILKESGMWFWECQAGLEYQLTFCNLSGM